jgi:NAD-dependent dihydropyrimidine dehydrogenase PreA subunit
MPPVIDRDKCKVCGKCVDICLGDIFYGSEDGKIPVVSYPEECWHEASCIDVCPVKGAIKLRIPLPMMISYK